MSSYQGQHFSIFPAALSFLEMEYESHPYDYDDKFKKKKRKKNTENNLN